jgi:DNA-binding XRE family transcriptional regulator
MSERMEVAELISIRGTLKMNRTQLAQAIGVHPSTIDGWEAKDGRRQRPIPSDKAWQIRSLYNRMTETPEQFCHSPVQLQRTATRRLIEPEYEDYTPEPEPAVPPPPDRTVGQDICFVSGGVSLALAITSVVFVYGEWSVLPSFEMVLLLSSVPFLLVSCIFLFAFAGSRGGAMPRAMSS